MNGGKNMRLADCNPGIKARVTELLIKPAFKKRFLDLGMLPGTVVEVVRKIPFGGPMIIQVRGYQVGIRASEAKEVVIEPYA